MTTAGAALFYAKGGYGWANNRLSFSALGLTYLAGIAAPGVGLSLQEHSVN